MGVAQSCWEKWGCGVQHPCFCRLLGRVGCSSGLFTIIVTPFMYTLHLCCSVHQTG